MKKIASIVAAFAMILSTAGPASAAWLINDDSTFDLLRARFASITLSNSNTALISNTLVSTSATGGNTINADEDVENGEIVSGDAEAAAEVENVANEIDSEAELDASGEEEMQDNLTVDDDSDLDVDDTETDAVVDVNANTVAATNAVITTAASGGNTVNSENDDVEGGAIESGSASTASSVANAFNILRARIMLNR